MFEFGITLRHDYNQGIVTLRTSSMPTCWIIAGPNGAGKTTFALAYLPTANCLRFVNADLIASGLSPLSPDRELLAASRLFLGEIEAAIVRGENFAFETTLAGRGHLRVVRRLITAGWHVELIYLALPDVQMSKLRVAERVAHGGHDIPIMVIERRFPRSLANLLNVFSSEVSLCRCFMNSGSIPVLAFEQQGKERKIVNRDLYQTIVAKIQL